MSHLFFDSSALAKRYLQEVGTAWIRALLAPVAGNIVIVAEITQVEVAAAMAARHRAQGGISRQERDDAVDLLHRHFATQYQITALSPVIIDRAVNLTQNYRLRGYDAVQLATALRTNELLTAAHLPALMFIVADSDLVAVAGAEGLRADDPNQHP